MDNIKKEIDDLFDELKETLLYKDYLRAKKQLYANEEIISVINEIKRLQKLATNNKDEVIEKNIKQLYEKLNGYPLYQSYLILKEDLEKQLFNIINCFDIYFNDVLKLY